jgi:hypothetical protein
MDFAKGEVLYDPTFMYPSSTQPCDKLLLIVNKNHSHSQDVVIIPATTHQDDYSYKPFCNEIEKIFYFDTQIGFYKQKTILQLYLIDLISMELLENKISTNCIHRLKNKTTPNEFGQIINCLKRMKDDIPFFIQELIF